jgi:hypothetical protein
MFTPVKEREKGIRADVLNLAKKLREEEILLPMAKRSPCVT